MGSSSESGDIVSIGRYRERPTTVLDEDDDSVLPRVHADSGEAPARIGRYVVLDTIGMGGMGVVCTAYDPKLDRRVALKLLRMVGDRRRLETSRARLVREAQALAKLSHPNIVTVHDVDTQGDQLYIAMEYVEGKSLDDWLHDASRPWPQILEIFGHAGRGLAAAHAAGIVHRDFKPGNVQIGDDGRVRVLDFGLAKSGDDPDSSFDAAESLSGGKTAAPDSGIMDLVGSTADLKLTQVGRTVGTPAYMAPEQFHGLPVTDKTDQLSFAVALYEALFGRLPYADEDDEAFVDRVCEATVRDPPPGTPVPSWVHRVVLRALHRRPEERWPSMDAMLVALAADPARRRRRIATGVGLVGLLGLAGFGVVSLLGDEAEPDRKCTAAQQHIDAAWGPEQHEAVEQAFMATEVPYAYHAWKQVSTMLDDWTQRWAVHHTEVCEATTVRGEQSTALMDVRMACLDRGRAELAGLVTVFSQADAQVVGKAVSAAQSLADIDRCPAVRSNVVGAVPGDPEQARRAREIDETIARARSHFNAGKYEPGRALADRALTEAKTLAHPPTLARALSESASADFFAGRYEEAADGWEAAVRVAAEAGVAYEEAAAWSRLIFVEGDKLERHESALGRRLAAEIALERAGNPEEVAAYLSMDLGVVLTRAGRRDEGLEAMSDAVARLRRSERRSEALAVALNNHGIGLAQNGRIEEARDALRESLEIRHRVLGRRHPLVASSSVNLGNVLRQVGDREGARARYEEAVESLREIYGEDHRGLVLPLLSLASLLQRSDPTTALQRGRDALRLLRAQPGAPPTHVITLLGTLAEIELRLGFAAQDEPDPDGWQAHVGEAEHYASEAVQTLEGAKVRPLATARALGRHCRVLAADDRLDEARPVCTKAVEAYANTDELDDEHAEAMLGLARSLPASQRAQAVLLATAAVHHAAGERAEATAAPGARLVLAQLLWADPAQRATARALAMQVRDDEAAAPRVARIARDLLARR